MEQTQLENLVRSYLQKRALLLSELKWLQEGKSRILQMSIMTLSGTMDLDTCTSVSQDISPHLDEWLKDMDNYTLEVCSPGAERPLNSIEDIKSSLDKHVYVLFLHPINKSLEWTGKLISFDGEKGQIEVRIKSRTKVLDFDYQNIVKIRLAVVL